MKENTGSIGLARKSMLLEVDLTESGEGGIAEQNKSEVALVFVFDWSTTTEGRLVQCKAID